MPNLYAEVIPSLRLPKQFTTFDYILPDELKDKVCAGSIVFVPFGKKIILGIVLKTKEKCNKNILSSKIKPIKNTAGNLILPPDLLKTIFWMKNNLDVSLPLALKTILPDMPQKIWK